MYVKKKKLSKSVQLVQIYGGYSLSSKTDLIAQKPSFGVHAELLIAHRFRLLCVIFLSLAICMA